MRKSKPLQQRLMALCAVNPGGCWDWVGTTNGNGYGHVSVNGRPHKAHRASYEVFIGPIPEGLDIDHLCRNRRCINPNHLEPVTRKENLRRSPTACISGGIATSRIMRARTECKHGHKYDDENIMFYRGWRRCRACNREQSKQRYDKLKAGAK